MNRLTNRFAGFVRREGGSATVEMVILFPIFMILFISSFELGMLMLRQAMLDRSLDMTVRELRLGLVDFAPVAGETEQKRLMRFHDEIRQRICQRSNFLVNCSEVLKLEMEVVDPVGWTGMNADVDCINLEDTTIPPTTLETGEVNALVVIRACHLFDPYVTGFALGPVLGDLLPKENGNAYRLVATASYVLEPI
jgi:hypothetical protein